MTPFADLPLVDLHLKRHAELQARMLAHQDTIAHGIQGLNLIAVGDSWFDYPLYGDFPGVYTDILANLRTIGNPKPEILSLAHYGYTSTQELGLQRQTMLSNALKDPANGKFDAILMSGGGNDIAGDALVLWLNESRPGIVTTTDIINLSRFNGMLDNIRASYEDLIDIRDDLLPDAPIFVHSYDYPQVTGKGVCTLGPWLKPAFDFCGYTNELTCNLVIAQMMRLFAVMLDSLASVKMNNVVHVRTLGTIAPFQFSNELHPNPSGFKLLASKFKAELSRVFVGRV